MTTGTLDLTGLTLEQLADELTAAYADGFEDRAARIIAHVTAQDDARDDARQARARRRAAAHWRAEEWRDHARAEWLAAEAECAGVLLNRRGVAAGIDPEALWTGTEAFAMAYASEELRNWWAAHPRLTVTDFKRQAAAQREAYDHDIELAESAAADVRPEAAEAAAPARAAVPVPRTRPGAGGTRADCRPGDRRPARPAGGRVTTGAGAVAVAVREARSLASRRMDGAKELGFTRGFLDHHGVWPSEAVLTAATAYVAQAHARDPATGLPVWPYSPRWFLTSAKPGSGKSTLGRLMAFVAPNGKILVEPTKAALIDLIAEHATVVVTELDELLATQGRNRGLVAVINASYEPDHRHARKSGGKVQEVELFAPMILDGLDSLLKDTRGDLKTFASRCLVARVRCAPDGYRAPRFDRQARSVAGMIRDRTAAWMAQEVADGIGDEIPELPEGLGNRRASLWEPLVATCDRAGGAWPEMIRDACVQMEAAAGMPGDDEDDDAAELDRVMASWATERSLA